MYPNYRDFINNIKISLKESGAKDNLSKVKKTPNPTIWWNKECSQLINKRRELAKNFKNDMSETNFNTRRL